MNLFGDINVMNKALDAAVLRHSAISSNISNVDTPGYKRLDVRFETLLSQEMNKKGSKTINVDTIDPKVYIDNENYSYRLDGNNIDIDVEMAEEAKVVARYNVLASRTAAQLGRYKTILQNLK